jgi:cell division protein FtsB
MSSIHRSRHSRSRARTRLIIILAAALGAMFILSLVLGVKLTTCGRQVTELTILERKQGRQLAEMAPKIAELEQEVAQLVKSRLPNLRPLEFDKVFHIGEAYVKNVVFTITRKNGIRYYEYKIVMDNQDFVPVAPHVQILLFDRDGIQIGFSELGVDTDGVPSADILERGEIRSHAAQLSLTEEIEPKYFLLRIKGI